MITNKSVSKMYWILNDKIQTKNKINGECLNNCKKEVFIINHNFNEYYVLRKRNCLICLSIEWKNRIVYRYRYFLNAMNMRI